MTLLLLLSLFITAPTISTPAYCEEVREVLMEAVEEGLLSINEANEMYARCARAPEIEQNSP